MTAVDAPIAPKTAPTHRVGDAVAVPRVPAPLSGICAGMARRAGGPAKTTPLRAIRRFCLWCCCDSSNEVTHCSTHGCALWEYRAGRRPQQAILTPLRAVRARCLDCVENSGEVRRCLSVECPLHVYRMGHRPKVEGQTNNERT
jgi:hypothetical protein